MKSVATHSGSRAGVCLIALVALLFAASASAGNVAKKEKVLPKNGNLVPFVISTSSGADGSLIHAITVDNEPTARRGWCTSDGSGLLIDELPEQCEDAGWQIVAIQIDDSFYRPGQLPITAGDDTIGVTSLGELNWDEYNMWLLEPGSNIVLWFRIDDSAAVEPRNKVAIEVVVGATGGDVALN